MLWLLWDTGGGVLSVSIPPAWHWPISDQTIAFCEDFASPSWPQRHWVRSLCDPCRMLRKKLLHTWAEYTCQHRASCRRWTPWLAHGPIFRRKRSPTCSTSCQFSNSFSSAGFAGAPCCAAGLWERLGILKWSKPACQHCCRCQTRPIYVLGEKHFNKEDPKSSWNLRCKLLYHNLLPRPFDVCQFCLCEYRHSSSHEWSVSGCFIRRVLEEHFVFLHTIECRICQVAQEGMWAAAVGERLWNSTEADWYCLPMRKGHRHRGASWRIGALVSRQMAAARV